MVRCSSTDEAAATLFLAPTSWRFLLYWLERTECISKHSVDSLDYFIELAVVGCESGPLAISCITRPSIASETASLSQNGSVLAGQSNRKPTHQEQWPLFGQ